MFLQSLNTMADILTKEQRSERMARIRSRNTRPEVSLRRALWHRGFRYRVNVRNLPGTPDIVLPKHRTVVFVNGCFWHGHKNCKNNKIPQTITGFWQAKVSRNQERDQDVWRQLEAKGWSVVIVWECELAKGRLDDTVERVAAEIIENGEQNKKRQTERREAYVLRRLEKKETAIKHQKLMDELRNIMSKAKE